MWDSMTLKIMNPSLFLNTYYGNSQLNKNEKYVSFIILIHLKKYIEVELPNCELLDILNTNWLHKTLTPQEW